MTTETQNIVTRYPAAEWLHHIEFPDNGTADDDPPCHISCRPVRFNGQRTEARIMRAPIEVHAGAGPDGLPRETVVSFTVHADDVEWTDVAGERVPYAIAGLRVLTVKSQPPEPGTVQGDVRIVASDYPIVHDGEVRTVRLHVLARTVAFTAV